ncbi:MAG: hypothetical protein MZU95_14000 [Desulfomicrobium escambiense]|nr:hypothetical protein [Desulfomicrobium escambiense]
MQRQSTLTGSPFWSVRAHRSQRHPGRLRLAGPLRRPLGLPGQRGRGHRVSHPHPPRPSGGRSHRPRSGRRRQPAAPPRPAARAPLPASPVCSSRLARLTEQVTIDPLAHFLDLALGREELFDFLAAPASVGYHHGYPGGLLEHSLEVAEALAAMAHPSRPGAGTGPRRRAVPRPGQDPQLRREAQDHAARAADRPRGAHPGAAGAAAGRTGLAVGGGRGGAAGGMVGAEDGARAPALDRHRRAGRRLGLGRPRQRSARLRAGAGRLGPAQPSGLLAPAPARGHGGGLTARRPGGRRRRSRAPETEPAPLLLHARCLVEERPLEGLGHVAVDHAHRRPQAFRRAAHRADGARDELARIAHHGARERRPEHRRGGGTARPGVAHVDVDVVALLVGQHAQEEVGALAVARLAGVRGGDRQDLALAGGHAHRLAAGRHQGGQPRIAQRLLQRDAPGLVRQLRRRDVAVGPHLRHVLLHRLGDGIEQRVAVDARRAHVVDDEGRLGLIGRRGRHASGERRGQRRREGRAQHGISFLVVGRQQGRQRTGRAKSWSRRERRLG